MNAIRIEMASKKAFMGFEKSATTRLRKRVAELVSEQGRRQALGEILELFWPAYRLRCLRGCSAAFGAPATDSDILKAQSLPSWFS